MAENQERGLRTTGRWDPFSELDLFDRLLGTRRGGFGRLFDEMPATRGFQPSVDVAENDDAYLITAELPGAKPEDVTVELHEGVLTIRGEKRNERSGEKEQTRWVERSYGSFSRSFTLPSNAHGDKVDAQFENGVLTITVPKREEAKPRTIAIKGS